MMSTLKAGKIYHFWFLHLQSTREWLNLTHKITREQSQMPAANITFYCTLFTLCQSYFSAIVESRANANHVTHSLMTQWRVHGVRRRCLQEFVSFEWLPSLDLGHSLLPNSFPGFSCDWDIDFHRNPVGWHFPVNPKNDDLRPRLYMK